MNPFRHFLTVAALSPFGAMTLALAFAACTSPAWHRLERSDGLLDFVLQGDRKELPVNIENNSGQGGAVTSSHLRLYGKGIFVSGLVRRQSSGEPPRGSHVDIVVVDAHGTVVEGVAVEYIPRDIPRGQRGSFPQSGYLARLGARPANDSTVRVSFHGVPRSGCDWAGNL